MQARKRSWHQRNTHRAHAAPAVRESKRVVRPLKELQQAHDMLSWTLSEALKLFKAGDKTISADSLQRQHAQVEVLCWMLCHDAPESGFGATVDNLKDILKEVFPAV